MKIHPVGAMLFHADRRMERDRHGEVNSHVLKFCKHAYKGNVENFKVTHYHQCYFELA